MLGLRDMGEERGVGGERGKEGVTRQDVTVQVGPCRGEWEKAPSALVGPTKGQGSWVPHVRGVLSCRCLNQPAPSTTHLHMRPSCAPIAHAHCFNSCAGPLGGPGSAVLSRQAVSSAANHSRPWEAAIVGGIWDWGPLKAPGAAGSSSRRSLDEPGWRARWHASEPGGTRHGTRP